MSGARSVAKTKLIRNIKRDVSSKIAC
jgi:hypothetical protein